MRPSTREYLEHILYEVNFLLDASKDVGWDSFRQDGVLRRAFVRSIEAIGDYIKQLPESVRDQHPAVEWCAIAEMSDHLLHAYYKVDYEMVWDAVTNKVPPLAASIRQILTRDDI